MPCCGQCTPSSIAEGVFGNKWCEKTNVEDLGRAGRPSPPDVRYKRRYGKTAAALTRYSPPRMLPTQCNVADTILINVDAYKSQERGSLRWVCSTESTVKWCNESARSSWSCWRRPSEAALQDPPCHGKSLIPLQKRTDVTSETGCIHLRN